MGRKEGKRGKEKKREGRAKKRAAGDGGERVVTSAC